MSRQTKKWIHAVSSDGFVVGGPWKTLQEAGAEMGVAVSSVWASVHKNCSIHKRGDVQFQFIDASRVKKKVIRTIVFVQGDGTIQNKFASIQEAAAAMKVSCETVRRSLTETPKEIKKLNGGHFETVTAMQIIRNFAHRENEEGVVLVRDNGTSIGGPFHSIDEAARETGLSYQTVRRSIAEGTWVRKVGGTFLRK